MWPNSRKRVGVFGREKDERHYVLVYHIVFKMPTTQRGIFVIQKSTIFGSTLQNSGVTGGGRGVKSGCIKDLL